MVRRLIVNVLKSSGLVACSNLDKSFGAFEFHTSNVKGEEVLTWNDSLSRCKNFHVAPSVIVLRKLQQSVHDYFTDLCL